MGTPITKQTGVSIGLVIAIIGLTVWLTTQLAGKVDTAELEKLDDNVSTLAVRVGDLTTQLAVMNNELKHLREHREGP